MEYTYKPIDCSVICLDIRNFTPTLAESLQQENYSFLELLQNVYSIGVDIAQTITCSTKKNQSFYINPTGDGFICIIFGEQHYTEAYLMGLLLCKKLTNLFNNHYGTIDTDITYFGIGIESGQVTKISSANLHSSVYTYIGEVINIAARIESVTKMFAKTKMIIGENLNQLLCQNIYNTNFNKLATEVLNPSITKEEKKKIDNKLNDMNNKCLVEFLHLLVLKGYEKNPKRLYKISKHSLENINFRTFKIYLSLSKNKRKKIKLLWE